MVIYNDWFILSATTDIKFVFISSLEYALDLLEPDIEKQVYRVIRRQREKVGSVKVTL